MLVHNWLLYVVQNWLLNMVYNWGLMDRGKTWKLIFAGPQLIAAHGKQLWWLDGGKIWELIFVAII